MSISCLELTRLFAEKRKNYYCYFFFKVKFLNSFSPSSSRTWTGRRCCRGKCHLLSSPPSAARKMSATSTRSSPLKRQRLHLRVSLACSPAKTRTASGILTTSLTSASGDGWGLKDFEECLMWKASWRSCRSGSTVSTDCQLTVCLPLTTLWMNVERPEAVGLCFVCLLGFKDGGLRK